MPKAPNSTAYFTPRQFPLSRTAPDVPLQNLGEKLAGLALPITAPAAQKSTSTPTLNRRPRAS